MIRTLLDWATAGLSGVHQDSPADVFRRIAASIGSDLGKIPRGLVVTFLAVLSWCIFLVVAWIVLQLLGIL